ncbi:universal stress protein [Hoeflea prorocentri]|uniref:Universal stress protein n=1 Tax=Hoeflea prorocentri TaxID=1922333 RepID=A0A9X3UFN1_9HYPH|nr:universal stress protein [Hoeflea prorocentri]MCY6379670.1 universal stress protein [Hoeflea prorocentri]MDA5397470.1 universal stress protein [Hoeflea prorocentri]
MKPKTLMTVQSTDMPAESIEPMLSLAHRMDAHLNIVVVGLVQTGPEIFYGGAPEYYINDRRSEMVRTTDKRVDALEQLARKAGVSVSVIANNLERSAISVVVGKHALFSDMVLIPHARVPGNPICTEAFNGILFTAGIPVLVLGEDEDVRYPFKRIVIAWNFEPEAVRAIHRSLQILEDAEDVRVVLVDPDHRIYGASPGDDIATFLTRHGLPVTVDVISSAEKDVADALLKHAADKDADLVVMGAYGHSRFQQWLLGGTTRDILQNASCPVFMVH